MNCLIVKEYKTKIRNHPTWRLKEIENNWDWEGFQIPLFLEDKSAFVHLPGQRVSDRKAIEKSSSTKKFREHQMEILYLGGFKQTVYFDTGRLQGYPLCEIDFLICWYGFQLGIDQLRCEKVFRFHCFLKTSQPLFIFQVKGFQIGKQLRKAVPPRNSGSIRWRYFI